MTTTGIQKESQITALDPTSQAEQPISSKNSQKYCKNQKSILL